MFHWRKQTALELYTTCPKPGVPVKPKKQQNPGEMLALTQYCDSDLDSHRGAETQRIADNEPQLLCDFVPLCDPLIIDPEGYLHTEA